VPRIALIGAGSTVFTRNLIGDVLCRPELASVEAALTRRREPVYHAAPLDPHGEWIPPLSGPVRSARTPAG
jgi:alpha-galactosidase/6-phospho-beta-glucosidase family protein